MNDQNNEETKYTASEDGASDDASPEVEYIQHDPSKTLIVGEGISDGERDGDHDGRSQYQRDVTFRFNTYDGSSFREVQLDWKSKIAIGIFTAILLVIIIGFAISALVAFAILAVMGAIIYGLSRLFGGNPRA